MLHFLRIACALAAIAISLLWIRSIWYTDEFGFGVKGHWWAGYAVSYQGRLFLQTYPFGSSCDESYAIHDAFPGPPDGAVAESVYPDNSVFGFAAYMDKYTVDNDPIELQPTLRVPHWFCIILFSLWPTTWFWRRRRAARRQHRGFCRACAYDLRFSRERCPECGTTIPGLQMPTQA